MSANTLRLSLSGPDLSRLRTLVEAMDSEMTLLSQHPQPTVAIPNTLLAAWSHVVGMLDLGPEPTMQVCPYCRSQCMREATRCVHCWESLSPRHVTITTAS